MGNAETDSCPESEHMVFRASDGKCSISPGTIIESDIPYPDGIARHDISKLLSKGPVRSQEFLVVLHYLGLKCSNFFTELLLNSNPSFQLICKLSQSCLGVRADELVSTISASVCCWVDVYLDQIFRKFQFKITSFMTSYASPSDD